MRASSVLRCCALSAALLLAGVAALWAQAPAGENFTGVKAVLSPQQYTAAGLDKLSPEERAKLDEYLRDYFSGATQRVAEKAATQAVDRAVKEKRVSAPTVIESRIVGNFTGWNARTVFVLENGERWGVVDGSRSSYAPIAGPAVLIARDTFGYKMAISGAGIMRVRRL